jgi:hypothetical protein
MTALLTESLEERVERLVSEHSDIWPPLHSDTNPAKMAAVIERIVGLERAIHEIAKEIERRPSWP